MEDAYCCEVCGTLDGTDTGCLAVLFEEVNTYEQAEMICNTTMRGDPDYCHKIPEGMFYQNEYSMI